MMTRRVLNQLFFSLVLLVGLNHAHAETCPGEDEISFSFMNIRVASAFAIFADYAGLKLDINPPIAYSTPLNFTCVHWEVAAKSLAKKYNLKLKIEDGTMVVSGS